jgi:hypothetical protein
VTINRREFTMKGKTMNIVSNVLIPLGLGLVCAVLVFGALAGKPWPLIGNPRGALIGLLVVGMAMCTPGIGQVAASGRWGSPLAMVGYALGLVILTIIVAGLAGWKLPLASSPVQAIAIVGLLIGVKFAIATASYFFRWLRTRAAAITKSGPPRTWTGTGNHGSKS